MKPYIFKLKNKSIWVLDTSPKYKINYALIITNDIIRGVEINFQKLEDVRPEVEVLNEIFSLTNEDDIKELLEEVKYYYNRGEANTEINYKLLQKFINKPESLYHEGKNKKLWLFIMLIYDYIYNRELKFNAPSWFRNSFIVKALALKFNYLFISDFARCNTHLGIKDSLLNAWRRWLNFILDYWYRDINYPPFLQNFPEGELESLLKEPNLGYKEIIHEIKTNFSEKLLTFFLKRYDVKNMLNYMILMLPANLIKHIPSFIINRIGLLIIILLAVVLFSIYNTLFNYKVLYLFLLTFILISIYITFFYLTRRIFFPRALFGATVAWTILSSVPQVKNLPEKLWLDAFLALLNFSPGLISWSIIIDNYPLLSYSIATILFLLGILVYIMSEMNKFMKFEPNKSGWYKSIERSLNLLILIYSITLVVGVIFAYDKISSPYIEDLWKYFYFTSIASFISIASQIMWEDKPMTEV